MNQYDADKIVIHNWPEAIQLSDGKWARNWDITFKQSWKTSKISEVSDELSYQGFSVRISFIQEKKYSFQIITDDWSWEDYLYFNTYKMFEEINDLIGEIETIQGQPRDCWDPWLRNNRNPEGKYDLLRVVMEDIEVGLRTSAENGISFFGIEEVNDLILQGGKVVLIKPYGAITQEIATEDKSSSKRVISGFSITVTVQKTLPSPKSMESDLNLP
jgi:hypothetical protein